MKLQAWDNYNNRWVDSANVDELGPADSIIEKYESIIERTNLIRDIYEEDR